MLRKHKHTHTHTTDRICLNVRKHMYTMSTHSSSSFQLFSKSWLHKTPGGRLLLLLMPPPRSGCWAIRSQGGWAGPADLRCSVTRGWGSREGHGPGASWLGSPSSPFAFLSLCSASGSSWDGRHGQRQQRPGDNWPRRRRWKIKSMKLLLCLRCSGNFVPSEMKTRGRKRGGSNQMILIQADFVQRKFVHFKAFFQQENEMKVEEAACLCKNRQTERSGYSC